MERAYTGKYWEEKEIGFYHCIVCNTRLFSFDQRMRKQVGYASFFDCVDKRITVVDEQANFDLANTDYIPFF